MRRKVRKFLIPFQLLVYIWSKFCRYKNKETLKQHRSDVHDIVDKRIRYPYEQITIPDYFDMSCDECPTIMKSFKHAISHYLEEHQIVKGYVKCCGKKLKAPSIVRDHIEFHQNLNIFRYKVQLFSTTTRSNFFHFQM